MHKQLTVSIVINTYNRAESLALTLRSLRRLNYSEFEVVVINGPSTDHTERVIKLHRRDIRAGSCAARNLSISRNAGIEMARGELVAFLDDDAIPDEDWLNDIVAAFDSEEIGGAGGIVYDYTGYGLQYRYSVSNRLGTAAWNIDRPGEEFCYPGCLVFPYLQGTNAAFRRRALLEIGGFDEEFDYYLDETDVCLRMVDAGYLLTQLPNARVYHRFLASHLRNKTHIVTNWHPIIKNKVYFALKNAPPEIPFRDMLKDCERFCATTESDLLRNVQEGNAPRETLDQFHHDADTGLREGVLLGFTRSRRLMGSEAAKELRGPVATDLFDEPSRIKFKPFPTLRPEFGKLTICLLSQEYPPIVVGGIGRLTYELACGLAGEGHSIHVLTRSEAGQNTVSFEDDVWVHRLALDQIEPPPPTGMQAPARIWQWSSRLLREVRRIHSMHPVDVVEGPVWDAEGLATVVDGSFTTVTRLEAPLKMALETNPGWTDGSLSHRRLYEELIAAETIVVNKSTAVRAISHAIADTMRGLYGIQFTPGKLSITPLGMRDRSVGLEAEKNNEFVDVLFAGRFENRKGIDVLFQVIPSLCSKFERARFILAGADKPQSDGQTLAMKFRQHHSLAPFIDRVIFTGKIPDAELERRLAQCDILVAPSRYDSFGLVFLEGMMFGKPVVGTTAGGVPEIVQDGVNGILASPGDAGSLHAALATLLPNRTLRQDYGKAGREIYLKHFTREKFVERTLALYRRLLSCGNQPVAQPLLNQPVRSGSTSQRGL